MMTRGSVNEDDDDLLSDVDDEVFIRDGKHGIFNKLGGGGNHEERPLMPPRRKYKSTNFMTDHHLHHHHQQQQQHHQPSLPLRTLFAPFLYTMIGFVFIIGILVICIVAITRLPTPTNLMKDWLHGQHENNKDKTTYVVPCTSLNSQLQWTRTLPKLTSEAPLRSNDVNGDDVLDIIVGFSTGLDSSSATEFTCKLYFDQNSPCLGGVLALDGKTGETIWTHWTGHAIFSVDCGLDLNDDTIKDCVVAGRGGILHAINGKDGTSIWELPSNELSSSQQQRFYDIYDARYIADMDDDGIGDVVASHNKWQPDGSRSEVILVSGKSGTKINKMDFPGKEQLFVAPQVIVHPDGETYLILVASDQKKSGGLYIIPHSNLLKGEFKLQKLYQGPGRGVSLPPLLIDVNSDGTEDIIVAMTNSTVMAFDGLTFKEIWNYTIDNSEIISIPVPGYYNDDKVPDFMIKMQIPGFPVYYYTTTTILNGKTGKPLLETPMEDTMSAQMSGLSITVDGYGNDWFLRWSADCLKKEGSKEKYEFFRNPDSDADLCKLRFNSTLVTSLYAFSQHVGPPGVTLYRSEAWKALEFNNTVDPRKTADDYMIAQSELNGSTDQLVNNHHRQNKNLESEDYQKSNDFYSKVYNNNPQKEDEQQRRDGGNFFNKHLDDMNDKENIQTDDAYDETYDDDDEERLIASRQLNEIRLQRSEKSSNGRFIKNDTNDVQNHLDPSMDYTNGQSKQGNYFTSLQHFGRSNNSEDVSTDYIDFVDNIKEVEALTERRRRRENNFEINAALEQSDSNEVFVNNYKIIGDDLRSHGRKVRNLLAKTIKKDRAVSTKKNERRRKRVDEKKIKKYPGIQRQPPTGILLPALNKKSQDKKNPIDLVFSTYWLPPSSTPFVLLSKDLNCIEKAEEKLGKKLTSLERESTISDCLASRGVSYQSYQEATDKENTRIALGQMTLYRMRLQCVCPEDMLNGQTCKDISNEQKWPEHLGAAVSGYFDSWRK